jgi:hypothetical protein
MLPVVRLCLALGKPGEKSRAYRVHDFQIMSPFSKKQPARRYRFARNPYKSRQSFSKRITKGWNLEDQNKRFRIGLALHVSPLGLFLPRELFWRCKSVSNYRKTNARRPDQQGHVKDLSTFLDSMLKEHNKHNPQEHVRLVFTSYSQGTWSSARSAVWPAA